MADSRRTRRERRRRWSSCALHTRSRPDHDRRGPSDGWPSLPQVSSRTAWCCRRSTKRPSSMNRHASSLAIIASDDAGQQPQPVDGLDGKLGGPLGPRLGEVAVPQPHEALVQARPDPYRKPRTELLGVVPGLRPAREHRVRVGLVLDQGPGQRVRVRDEECLGLVDILGQAGRGVLQGRVDDAPSKRQLVGGGVDQTRQLVLEQTGGVLGPLDVPAHPVGVGGGSG